MEPKTFRAFARSCLGTRNLARVLMIVMACALNCPAQKAYLRHTDRKRHYLTSGKFESERALRVAELANRRFCADEILTDQEKIVGARLSNHVAKFYADGREKTDWGPTRPFYLAKPSIESTELFRLLRQMPKGGLLHTHLSAAGRIDWIIANAMASSNCYVHWPADCSRERGTLKLFTPEVAATNPGYAPIGRLCAEVNDFTNALREALTLGADDVGTGNRVWAEFSKLFTRTGDFIRYRQVFTNYLLDAFETLWNDGVFYVELRDSLGGLCDINGANRLGKDECLRQLMEARAMMKARHPEFECRLIVAGYRSATADEIIASLSDAVRLSHHCLVEEKKFITGFDLVGEEFGATNDATRVQAAAILSKLCVEPHGGLDLKLHPELQGGGDLPFYLHDGESAWADNDNLVDAVLLCTPRIGHAFNLFRFPELVSTIRSNNVALEICPISNQLLGLTPDLRTHPAAGYLNAGIQCTLASDDPALFRNDGLTYDFWEATVAWNLDLAALKKLARNSITYSALDDGSKTALLKFWEIRWEKFIQANLPQ